MIGTTLKSKLLRNLGANAYGQLITVVIQLASVPLYLHYWGVELYGEWLILSAIPAYLALSDIGFASVAANDMTMRVANGDRRGALGVYQSIWIFISSVSMLLGTALTLIIYVVPVNVQFSIRQINEEHTRQLLIVLMLYVFVGLQAGVLQAAFRAAGRYAYGTTLTNTVRLAEWAVTMVSLLLGGGVLDTAISSLTIRFLGLMVTWVVLKKQEQWLTLGLQAASLQQVRHLLKPAMAFMTFPLGLALSIQGMVLVIGMSLGASSVVMFTAYRTLTRLLVQVITMLNQALWPEISAAYGTSQIDLVRYFHRRGSCLSLWTAFIAVVFLYIIEGWVVDIWIGRDFLRNETLFLLLLITAFLNVLWQTSLVVLMATNEHTKISLQYLFLSALGVFSAYVLMLNMGINGAGLSLIFFEVPMLIIVVGKTLKFVSDDWMSYLMALFLFRSDLKKRKN